MSNPDRRQDYLERMGAAARQIQSYVEGFDKDEFLADKKTQDAVIMKLMVIGELAAQLLDDDPAFTSATPTVPSWQMKGMRNRMAHGYFELDLDTVWDTTESAIPALTATLGALPR